MNTIDGIRVCAFDAYGTLMDLSAMMEPFRPELGVKTGTLFKLWRRRQLEISWLPGQTVGRADFWMVTSEALEEAMTFCGLGDSGLRNRLMQAWLEPPPYPDVADCLRRLRQGGVRTAILSNGTRRMLEAAIAAADLREHLDAVLSAEEVGVFKPDPGVYKLVMDHFAVKAPSVCLLSGNGWDISGAARSGFQSILLNRSGGGSGNLPRGTLTTISTLAELPALLGVCPS